MSGIYPAKPNSQSALAASTVPRRPREAVGGIRIWLCLNILAPVTTVEGPYGFWSYVHRDDDAEDGRILRLGQRLKDEYELITGGDQIDIFVDRDVPMSLLGRNRQCPSVTRSAGARRLPHRDAIPASQAATSGSTPSGSTFLSPAVPSARVLYLPRT